MRSNAKSNDTLSVQNRYNYYKIQPGDVIDIKVSSLDPQSVAIFNKNVGVNQTNQVNDASIYLNGYSIDDSGYVSLPIIGKILVKDLEVPQVKTVIENKMKSYYKFSSVDIKLMNFRVTIVGEVNAQGSYPVYRDQANILQLIGMAGGFTDVADKKKIKIIRKEDNVSKMFYINLGDSKIIGSEDYYMQPNDVVYVEPLRAKALKVNAPTIQLALSALTFIIVITNLLSR